MGRRIRVSSALFDPALKKTKLNKDECLSSLSLSLSLLFARFDSRSKRFQKKKKLERAHFLWRECVYDFSRVAAFVHCGLRAVKDQEKNFDHGRKRSRPTTTTTTTTTERTRNETRKHQEKNRTWAKQQPSLCLKKHSHSHSHRVKH